MEKNELWNWLFQEFGDDKLAINQLLHLDSGLFQTPTGKKYILYLELQLRK